MPCKRLIFAVALVSFVSPLIAKANDIPLDPGAGGRSIDVAALQPGDLIFSTTTSTISQVIRSVTGDGPVSHVKVYIGQINGIPMIVQAEPVNGVEEVSLTDSLAQDSLDVVFRYHNGLSSTQQRAIVSDAISQLGKNFDYWGAVKNAVFNFLGTLNYGQDFDGSGQHRFYCSKLVIALYNDNGLSLLQRDPGWSPNDLVTLGWVNNTLDYIGHLKYQPALLMHLFKDYQIVTPPRTASEFFVKSSLLTPDASSGVKRLTGNAR